MTRTSKDWTDKIEWSEYWSLIGATVFNVAPNLVATARCLPNHAAGSWFLKHCNASARARCACHTFRPDRPGTTATSNRSTIGCARSASIATLEQSVRSPGGYRRLQIRAQPPPPAFDPRLPNAGRVRCGVQAHPHPGACEMNRIRTKDTDSKTGCDVFPRE